MSWLIGEIRDRETAAIARRLAHGAHRVRDPDTNDACSSTRDLRIGSRFSQAGGAVKGIVAANA